MSKESNEIKDLKQTLAMREDALRRIIAHHEKLNASARRIRSKSHTIFLAEQGLGLVTPISTPIMNDGDAN